MKILVCVKQVPDQTRPVCVNDTRVDLPEVLSWKMNRFDEFAVEAAIQIKESIPGTTVDSVTIGPERTQTVVRRSLGMGADNGWIIHVSPHEGLTPRIIAQIICHELGNNHYDLILTGFMSEDNMNAQTGQMIAAQLNVPSVSGVIQLTVNGDQQAITVVREMGGGMREELLVQLPAVLCVQSGINQPRYPRLSAMLKAASRPLRCIESSTDGIFCQDQMISQIQLPKNIRDAHFLEGSVQEQANALSTLLKEKGFL
ncbi:MAG: electron transfer flavoprotein subunit beta/FixA family protein [Candidatus Magnetomorum sp.]|nr:electron transfer flavoprotein subunit beta/FixA family protein [Candidatus Magnetomorum sp.]